MRAALFEMGKYECDCECVGLCAEVVGWDSVVAGECQDSGVLCRLLELFYPRILLLYPMLAW